MLSFRQKILLSYIVVFVLILILLVPFSTKLITRIVKKTLEDRTQHVIHNIQDSPNLKTIIRKLDEQQSFVFFRVTLLTKKGKILYDSHLDKLSSPAYRKHPDIESASVRDIGYHEDYSHLFNQRFAYVAKRFEFHDTTYILRTAFPFKQIRELTEDFKIAILTISVGMLLLFSFMTWIIINRLTRPIYQIIKAIKPFQEGKQDQITHINLGKQKATKDFEKLASTINSLSDRIQAQIETLTHERNEKEALLNSLIEGIIAVDMNMDVTFANDVALTIFDSTKDQLIEKPFTADIEAKCYGLLNRCQGENKIVTDRLELKKQNDKRVIFDLVACPRKNHTGAILVLQDKSGHYKILEMGKAFIANASHELKTPITIIRGFSETLHDHPELSKNMVAEITNKIVLNCQRMETLVRNLLRLADIENLPHSKVQDCDLLVLLQGCRHILQSVHNHAEVSINEPTDKTIPFKADPDLLELAIMNLLENSVKYSKNNPKISITLEEDKEYMKIIISDNGIGVPSKDLPYIFQRFYTVDKAHARKLGGAGLGLSIVDTIIKKHSGKIIVTSKINEGSTFTIFLPKIHPQTEK